MAAESVIELESLMKLIVGMLGVLAIIIFLVIIFTKSRRKNSLAQQPVLPQNTVKDFVNPSKISAEVDVKQCPTCHTTYTDKTLNYCLLDGDILKHATGSTADYDPEATVVR